MKIVQTSLIVKCDSIYCHNAAKYVLITNTYKGDLYFCKECYQILKSIFKKEFLKDDKRSK